jgi:hypothetical protein
VIAHCIEIVNGRALASLQDIWVHVQPIYRELYLIVDLFGGEKGAPLVAEPLKVKNEVLGASVNLHLLKRVLVILAPRAVPLVITGECLFLAE